MDAVRVFNTVYLLYPFFGIFLEGNLNLVEAWSCFQGDILDAGIEVDF